MHSASSSPPPSRASAASLPQGVEASTGYSGAWTGTIPPHEDDELVGTTLCNTYVIERVLGEGGMGRVYQARHTRIQRKAYAIKALHPEYVRNADVVKRFQREAEAAASIPSEHVIGVYDVDRTPDGRPFLVAELLDGRELGDLLDQKGKLDVPYAVGIVRQICSALSAAHAQGVVHRDMKPENVFLTGDVAAPHVKVLDFGISRLDDGAGEGLTKTGMIMGTPSYMPPEQARGERVDHRADIYAVGCILYTALTGAVPFDREEPSATVVAVLTEEPVRPRALEPSIPEHLEAIIQRAMAKDPDERFASMDELDQALEMYDTLSLGEGVPVTLRTGRETRPRQLTGSRTALEQEAYAVSDARPMFVLLSIGAVVGVAFGLFSSAASIVVAWRHSGPSALELLIGGVALVAAGSTPLFLVAREIRRSSWNNSMRMLELSEALRVALIAGAAVYGFGWLMVAAIDHVIAGRYDWTGWDGWLFLAALIAAVLTGRTRARGAQPSRWTRPLISFPIAAAALTALVVTALALRDEAAPAPVLVPAGEPATSASAPPSSAVPASPPVAKRASEAELAQAKQGGLPTLQALAEKYPDDPEVLRSLLIAHSAAPGGTMAALETAERLYKLDPEALQDEVIMQVLRRAADGPPEQRAKALAIIGLQLGPRGPDVLYDIAHSNSAARADAGALLGSDSVKRLATPALLIAVDLREASGCDQKAALLDRVVQHGDERCIEILQPLTVGKRSGCGFLNLGACPAQCHAQAGRMQQAITAIRARQKKK